MLKLSRKEEKIILAAVVLILVAAAAWKFIVFKNDDIKVYEADNTETAEQNKAPKTSDIYVYITGEVVKPGVHVLKEGDRVIDAVNAAGGFTGNADITSVNLAGKLKDEQYININPRIAGGEDGSVPEMAVNKSPIIGGKININTATARDLDEFLPGIGETYANNIVNYREKNGRFNSVEDITKVEGIGTGKRYDRIKDMITVN